MRTAVYTKDEKHPHTIFAVECDLDLLTACIKEGSVKPDTIINSLKLAMGKVNQAILKGQAKAKTEAEEK